MRLIPRHRHRHRTEGPADRDQPGGDHRRPASTRRRRRRADAGAATPERREAARMSAGAARGPPRTSPEAFAAAEPGDDRSRTLVWQDPVPTAAAGATMTGMEYMRAIVAGELPPPPIAVTMRLRPIELEEGRAVFEGEPGRGALQPDRRRPRRLRGDAARLGARLRRPHDAAGRRRLHLARPGGEVRAPDHPRHRPRPLRGERPLSRPPPGHRRGEADRRRQRQAARPRHRHLHDPRRRSQRRGSGGARSIAA